MKLRKITKIGSLTTLIVAPISFAISCGSNETKTPKEKEDIEPSWETTQKINKLHNEKNIAEQREIIFKRNLNWYKGKIDNLEKKRESIIQWRDVQAQVELNKLFWRKMSLQREYINSLEEKEVFRAQMGEENWQKWLLQFMDKSIKELDSLEQKEKDIRFRLLNIKGELGSIDRECSVWKEKYNKENNGLNKLILDIEKINKSLSSLKAK